MMMRRMQELTNRIIGLAIKVHRKLGPGLLESIYEECLCWELAHDGMVFKRQVPLSVIYEDMHLNGAYYADIIAERSVLVELKSVEHLLPVHEAQTLTYLRLSGCEVALLMNFNSVMLKNGLRRFIPWRGLCYGRLASPLEPLALMRIEEALTQPDRARSDLDQLVVFDVGDRLLQAHATRRDQQHRVILAGGADVGELLLLDRVHFQV